MTPGLRIVLIVCVAATSSCLIVTTATAESDEVASQKCHAVLEALSHDDPTTALDIQADFRKGSPKYDESLHTVRTLTYALKQIGGCLVVSTCDLADYKMLGGKGVVRE